MGTNYYVIDPSSDERLHLGKSSAGWAFAVQVYPELGISNMDDWIIFMGANPLMTIETEYGYPVSLKQLLETILNRRNGNPLTDETCYPYKSALDFILKNKCHSGFCGLLFSNDGKKDATWPTIEYFDYEFS